MGLVDLILGMVLTTWAGGGGNLCYLIKNYIDYYKKNFSNNAFRAF